MYLGQRCTVGFWFFGHIKLLSVRLEVPLQAYTSLRAQGEDDMGSLVLGMSNELLELDFRDTFTNAFEVSAPGAVPHASLFHLS